MKLTSQQLMGCPGHCQQLLTVFWLVGLISLSGCSAALIAVLPHATNLAIELHKHYYATPTPNPLAK